MDATEDRPVETLAQEGVTVVIPVYNCERFLKQAIRSALSQSYSRCDVLVVNDGSTDSTQDIIDSFGTEVVSFQQSNQGTSTAWNLAISKATNEFLVGLDADDELFPETVQELMRVASRDDGSVDVWYSDYEFIDENGDCIKQVQNPDVTNEVDQLIRLHDRLGQPDNFLPFGHVRMYRRSSMIKFGGFNPTYRFADDFELMLRLARCGARFRRVPGVFYRYRWHTTNKGVVDRPAQIDSVRLAVREHYREQNSCGDNTE